MPDLGVSWALAQTVDGALKISRDALLAASGDNIQPFVLAACEKFGVTLAISSFTQVKIEDMLRKQAKSPVQKFWSATFGWAKGDSTVILSRSVEGIRFLSLAAALFSSSNNFDAATALATIIQGTAEDKELSPTLYQLKDLLDVLEPRLNHSRFLDVVFGYQALLSRSSDDLYDSPAVPSPEAIQKLVDSFRELSRVGPADVRSLKITLGRFAAWVSAFTRWCVEIPSIVCNETGAVIVDQPNAQVTICISKDDEYEYKIGIETIYEYNNSQQLVSAIVKDESDPILVTGMVTVETYALFLLKSLRFNDGLGREACAQALPYAVHLVKSRFLEVNLQNTDRLLELVHPLDPFPDDDVVGAMVKVYLGSTYDGPLIQRLPDDLQLKDLPAVRSWAQAERDKGVEKVPMTVPGQPFCGARRRGAEEDFLDGLSEIVADILALSLLLAEGTTDPKKIHWLVFHNHNRFRGLDDHPSKGLPSAIRPLLQDTNRCKADDLLKELFNHVFRLVGHEASEHVDNGRWVASAFRGQVIVPRFLISDDIEIPESGFACLSLFGGTILLETEKNRRFCWILSKYPGFPPTGKVSPEGPFSARTNTFLDDKIDRQLIKQVDHLAFIMAWKCTRSSQPPLRSLFGLGVSVIMEKCSHSGDTELEQDGEIVLLPPDSYTDEAVWNAATVRRTHVYPLYGNDALKIFALAALRGIGRPGGISEDSGSRNILINRGACINCALHVCQLQGIKYLIL